MTPLHHRIPRATQQRARGRRLREVTSVLLIGSVGVSCKGLNVDGFDPLIGEPTPEAEGNRIAGGAFHRLAVKTSALGGATVTALDEDDVLVVVDTWNRAYCRAGKAENYELGARPFADGPRLTFAGSPGPAAEELVVYATEVDGEGFGTLRAIDLACVERVAPVRDARLIWPPPSHAADAWGFWFVDRAGVLHNFGAERALTRVADGVEDLVMSEAQLWLNDGDELRVFAPDLTERGRLGSGVKALVLEPQLDAPGESAAWFEDDAGVHRVTVSAAGELVDELIEPGACGLERSRTFMVSMVSPCAGGELAAYSAGGLYGVGGGVISPPIPRGHRVTLGVHPPSPVEVYSISGNALFFFDALEGVGSDRVGTLWAGPLERTAAPIAERVRVDSFVFFTSTRGWYGFLSDWDGARGTLRAWTPTGEVRVLAEDVHELSSSGQLAITGHDGTRGTLVRYALDAPPEVVLEAVVSEGFGYSSAGDSWDFVVISGYDGETGTLSAVPVMGGEPRVLAREVRPVGTPGGWAPPDLPGMVVAARHGVDPATGFGTLDLYSAAGDTAELSDVNEWVAVALPTGFGVLTARESGLWLAWLP